MLQSDAECMCGKAKEDIRPMLNFYQKNNKLKQKPGF